MRYGGGGPWAEQSAYRKRPHIQHDDNRSKKKQKITSYSQTPTHIRFETLESQPTTSLRKCSTSYTPIPIATHNRREWTYSTRDLSKYIDKVVIVSYNILGVDNAIKHPEMYMGISPEYMEWEYRKKLLCKEVRRYQPSIMCFQEVDCFNDLNDILRKDGFTGVHKARSGEACDGCATFWKSDVFTLLHQENIEFRDFGLRHNVAQFCVLEMNQNLPDDNYTARFPGATTSRTILVGNIHVLYNPKRGDIKLGQMRIFLDKAYQLSQEWGCIPVVLAGDLNSLPQSAMYEFLASSELNIRQYDRREISGQTCAHQYSYHRNRPLMQQWTDEEMMLATGSRVDYLRHQFKLSSAYADIPGSSKFRDKVGEPLATSQGKTVDYIWHTSDLIPVKVLETLPMDGLKKTRLPSKEWGSDHFALVCELAFVDPGKLGSTETEVETKRIHENGIKKKSRKLNV